MCEVTSKKQAVGRPRPRSIPSDAEYDILADVTTPGKAGWWRPLHPLFALAMVPLLPSWCFLNRGFTQWFHWGFVFYLMTGQKDFWRRFLVLQGAAVSAGWYMAVVHDFLVHNRFCHLLYNQMPGSMKEVMLTDGKLASGGIIADNAPAVATLALAHLFDFIAHPLITYMIWKMHTKGGGTLRTLISWDLVFLTYAWSRVYSMTHLYHNDGAITGLFYYGDDVYNIDNQDSYTVAYVGEALFYVALICYKLYFKAGKYLRFNIRVGKSARRRRRRMSLSPKQLERLRVEDKQKPELVHSDTCFSTSSLPVDQ